MKDGFGFEISSHDRVSIILMRTEGMMKTD